MSMVYQFYNGYYPASGGVETHITDLVSNLDSCNFRIITDAFTGLPVIEKIGPNVTVKRMMPVNESSDPSRSFKNKKITFPYRFIKDVLRANNKRRYLKETEYDLLHIHGMNSGDAISRLSFIMKNDFLIKYYTDFSFINKPKIVTIHGLSSLMVENTFIKKIEIEYFKQFQNLICVDKKLFNYISGEVGSGSTVYHIPNGVDCNKFKFSHLNDNTRLQIGFIGRLEKSRGIDFLSNFLKYTEKNIDIYVIAAGNYKEIKRFSSMVDMKSINFYQNIKYESMPGYIQKFDVLFNPVIAEGISRATLEAMACGRPVIMLDKGDRYPVVHGKTGYLFRTNEDLIELINYLKDNKEELSRIGKNARKIIEKEYSNDVIIPQINKLYKKLI